VNVKKDEVENFLLRFGL